MTDELLERRIRAIMALPYHRVIAGDASDGYLAEIVELPGCVTAGETPEEALANLDEAMHLWLEVALAHDDQVPAPQRGQVVIAV